MIKRKSLKVKQKTFKKQNKKQNKKKYYKKSRKQNTNKYRKRRNVKSRKKQRGGGGDIAEVKKMKEETPALDDTFIPQESFTYKEGYTFRKGPLGLGLYKDVREEITYDREFIQSENYTGLKPNYNYGNGNKGVGYYLRPETDDQDRSVVEKNHKMNHMINLFRIKNIKDVDLIRIPLVNPDGSYQNPIYTDKQSSLGEKYDLFNPVEILESIRG